MSRRLKLLVAALLMGATPLQAAQIPLLSGPNYSDPSQVLATTNTVIQAVNNGVTGNVAQLPAAAQTSGTGALTVMPYTIGGGQLTVGSVFHQKVFGTNDSSTNVRTVVLNFGTDAVSMVVTGASTSWICDAWYQVQTATTQVAIGVCSYGAGLTTPVVLGQLTHAINASISTSASLTAATSGTSTIWGGYAEILR